MNAKVNDGGPAFPCEQHETQDNMWNQTFESGMTLRDYFAAKALQSLIIELAEAAMRGGKIYARKQICELAYEYADAMLAAREVQP